MTSTQPISLSMKDFQEHLKKNYNKQVSLQPVPQGYFTGEKLEVIDQLNKKDSFKSIHFPLIKFRTGYNNLPSVRLSGLDDHLKTQGKAVEGPAVPFPGLLAQSKYSGIDFQEATEGYSWVIEYNPQSVNTGSFEVTIEGGWRKLNSTGRSSFTAQVQSDSSLLNLFNQLISTCGMGTSWGSFSRALEPDSDLLLCVATSVQDDPFRDYRSNWTPLSTMSLESFTGLIWRCIVQKKPLRTAVLWEHELETLRLKAKEKKVEVKENLLESQAKQEKMEVKDILTNRVNPSKSMKMDRVTVKRFEAMHKETSELLRRLVRVTSDFGAPHTIPCYDPSAFDEENEGESEIALTETTVDES